jgi:hypothetical protein
MSELTQNKQISAIAVFPSNIPLNSKVSGTVVFKESARSNNIIIDIHLSGMTPENTGFIFTKRVI